ncbi:diguanylate cyclase domain-containing protein [Clostridium sp. ZS2-4]|uniref:diguanylate cyclase domain-containing protein n=1 Tax=Clostridium sp. ZS2-4 TaxID=2987703 RepID=UPI003FA353CC
MYKQNLNQKKVTISGGVAQLETGVETPEKMVEKADELLYKAKENGRNRIQWF